MLAPSIPLLPRGAPAPDARAFALLGGLEAVVRGLLLSATPVLAYRAIGDAQALSAVYTAAGVAALGLALVTPWLGRVVARRRLYVGSALGFVASGALVALDADWIVAAIVVNALATVVMTICFNAYLMDYVARADLGRAESLRLFWSAGAWVGGPFVGVWLMETAGPAAPFLASGAAALALIGLFLRLRFGEGRAIRRAKGPPPSPLAHLGRFLRRRRLVAGWALATTRSCGWMAFFIYGPVYAVQSGLGELTAGLIASLGSAFLFLSPAMGRMLSRLGVRKAVVAGFGGGALGWALAASVADAAPWLAVAGLLGAAVFMVSLDVSAGLPFLMAVKPGERAEMSAIYATFRESSLIATPAAGGLALGLGGVPAVFGTVALAYAAAAFGARGLPARLGLPRMRLAPLAAAAPSA
jgi:MFS family permease